MATFSLPRGRRIEVIATVNASLNQKVEIIAPSVAENWEGAGEGKRIGEILIEFPPGTENVSIQVNLSHAEKDGTWTRSHESVIEERDKGEIHVVAEDGRGALDANDLVVRFRWVV